MNISTHDNRLYSSALRVEHKLELATHSDCSDSTLSPNGTGWRLNSSSCIIVVAKTSNGPK